MDKTTLAEPGFPGRWPLAAILAAALALRLWHLGWGLPDLYEEATPLFRAWGFWNRGGSGLDLNPHFFNYPALTFLVQFLLQAVHAGVGFVSGTYPDLHAFHAAWSSDLPRFVLIGRLPGVLADLGTVAVAGILAGRLVSCRAGLVSAALVAVSPLQIRFSQMIVVDSILAFFSVCALLLMIEVARSGSMTRALQAGLLVGLAAATKYTGALLCAPLALAVMAGLHGSGAAARKSAGATASAVLLPILLACGVFIVLNPFILLDSASFLRDFGFERTHMSAGHFGIPAGESTPLYYLTEVLPDAIGWPALVLAIPGLVWAARIWDRRWLVAALGFGLLFLVPMFWAMRADRYMLPALPGLAVLFAAGLEWFWPPRALETREPTERHGAPGGARSRRWISRREYGPPVAAGMLVLAAFTPPLLGTIAHHRSLLDPDTRAGASAWIKQNLPVGSTIALTPAGVNVDSSYVQLPIPYLAVGLEGIAAVYDARWYTDLDLLVGSDFDRARFSQEPARYAVFMQFFYDSLAARWTTVWSGEPGPTRQGPRVWLFAPPREARAGLFPASLLARMETVATPRTLTVFAGNLAAVLDSRGRPDRARQVRGAAIDRLLRRFPDVAPTSIAFLSSMATRPADVLALADSLAGAASTSH